MVARGLARSRTHAQQLIEGGAVTLDGATVTRASLDVADDARLEATDDGYVSRAAYKLIGALDACAADGLTVQGRRALDAGASTGGFTQVLLERGAAHVTAIDVGHDQLAPAIAADPRVLAVEGFNLRGLLPDTLADPVDLVVADLSFISLTLVTQQLCAAMSSGDLLFMVKPQFEVGRDRLGAGGVVTSSAHHADAVAKVAAALESEGAVIHRVERSLVPGRTGNVEFFIWASLAWQARDGGDRPLLTGEALGAAIRLVTKGPL